MTFDDTNFIIPSKVIESPRTNTAFKNGRSIFCGNGMISPTVFPVVQARVMKAMGSMGDQPIMSKGSMQFLHHSVGLEKEGEEGGQDAINFAVLYKDKDPESCFHDLEKITAIIVTALYELSPGSSVETGIYYFS